MKREVTGRLGLVGVALLSLAAMRLPLPSSHAAGRGPELLSAIQKHEAAWAARMRAIDPDGRFDAMGRQTDADALVGANALLDETIDKRVWRADDAEAMRMLLLRLSQRDRDAVLVHLVQGLNSGRLRLAPGQAPL